MIKVPLKSMAGEQSRFLVISDSALPADIPKLLYTLNKEQVPITYWYDISLLYYREGRTSEFQRILEEALREVDPRAFPYLMNPVDDRIKAFNALASFHIQLSMICESEEESNKNTEKGLGLIYSADNLNFKVPITFITKCFWALSQGQLQQAQQQIEHFSHSNYSNPVSKIMKGLIEFSKGEYGSSLELFKSIQSQNPLASPQIRFAIGLCYFRLANLEKARFAFERTVELDPQNSLAFVALAIVELQTNVNDEKMRKKAAHHLEKAVKIDENNYLALRYLADHYFFKKEHGVAKKICEWGLAVMEHLKRSEQSQKENPGFRKEIDILRSDFHFIIGKIFHVQELYAEANIAYGTAIKFNNLNYPAQFCLAKIQYYLHLFQSAEQCLETIIQSPKFKDSYEALRLLAQSKARQGKVKWGESAELFKRVLELNPKDFEANFEIATLYEITNQKDALIYYEQGVKVLTQDIEERLSLKVDPVVSQEDEVVPPELFNNIGVLRLEIGQVEEALEAFKQAFKNCNVLLGLKPEDARLKAIKVTAKFNMAYWYEQHNRLGEATEYYKQIIGEEPAYTDAYIRLAYLAKNRGNSKRAFEYLEQSKAAQAKNREDFSKPTNATCIKAKMLHEVLETQQAYEEFAFVLEKLQKMDSYAMIGIANINYQISTMYRGDPGKQETYLQKAMGRYIAVLENDEANSFASLGIANILAEYGKQNEAYEIYKVLALSNPNMHHPLINQGHLQMAEKNFGAAINLYSQCLEKFFPNGKNLELELYLSKAYYKNKQFPQCKGILVSLGLRYPTDLRIRLNLALCLWSWASETFNKGFRKVSETKEAIQQLKQAEKMFQSLLRQQASLFELFPSNISKEQRERERREFGEMARICDEQLNYVQEMIVSSQSYLLFDEENERKIKEEEAEKNKKLLELQSKQDIQQQQLLEAQQKQLEEEQRRAEENAEKVAMIALDNIQTTKGKKGETRKGEAGFIDDKDDSKSEDEGAYQRLFGDDDDEEDEEDYVVDDEESKDKSKETERKREKKEREKGADKDKKEKKKKDKKDRKKKKDKKKKKRRREDGEEEPKEKKKRLKRNKDLEDEEEQQEQANDQPAPDQAMNEAGEGEGSSLQD